MKTGSGPREDSGRPAPPGRSAAAQAHGVRVRGRDGSDLDLGPCRLRAGAGGRGPERLLVLEQALGGLSQGPVETELGPVGVGDGPEVVAGGLGGLIVLLGVFLCLVAFDAAAFRKRLVFGAVALAGLGAAVTTWGIKQLRLP